MKTLLIILFVLSQGTYCDGFNSGYIDGYCSDEDYCIEPIPPGCPMPDVNRNTYKDGYQKGFLIGYEDNH